METWKQLDEKIELLDGSSETSRWLHGNSQMGTWKHFYGKMRTFGREQ